MAYRKLKKILKSETNSLDFISRIYNMAKNITPPKLVEWFNVNFQNPRITWKLTINLKINMEIKIKIKIILK